MGLDFRIQLSIAFGLCLSLGSLPCRAGNLDAFYLSGAAAMQGGAITADAEGGGAVWYNPAGLAALEGLRLDIGVNGYALRFGGQANLEPAIAGTDVTRLTRIDLNVVPTALGITRRWGPVGIGIGAFVPTQSASVLRTHFVTPENENGSQVDFSFDASSRFQNYHLGIALGLEATQRLSLGGALFINYQTLVENTDISLLTLEEGSQAAVASHYTLDAVQLGAEFVLGSRWLLSERWRFGAVARFPALRLGEVAQQVETGQVRGQAGSLVVENDFSQSLDIGTSIISPFRFHAGLSHDFRSDVRGAVEASLLLPFVDEALRVELRPTYNARVGLKKRVGPRLAFGGGIFTDLSPNADPSEFQESQLNFFGATAAMDLSTTYGIYAKNGEIYDRTKALRFSTTISLSYALGLGSVVQAQLGPDQQGGIGLETVPQDVVAHEITLHIGTTVME